MAVELGAAGRYKWRVQDMKSRRRLDQILSNYGYCSRSQARVWVQRGLVTVAGEVPKSADVKVAISDVLVEGEPVECPEGILALLHKSAGHVCSHGTKEGPSVYELLPPCWLKRNPPVTTIGRLDKDTTGVLLVTDLGELVQRWTSPKHKVTKIYEVTVDRDLDPGLVGIFASGELVLEDEEKACLPATLEIRGPREAWLHLVEGKFHQVKRMFASQGYTVTRLHRRSFGEIEVDDLRPGKWRLLALPAGFGREG